MTITKTIKFTEEEVKAMKEFTRIVGEVCETIGINCKKGCPFYSICQSLHFDAYESVQKMVENAECILED